MIEYRIVPAHPEAHLYAIQLTVPAPDPAGQRLSLPAWIPGSYMIRDFARHVVRLEAHCGGRPVRVDKLDKQTWSCAPCRGPLEVRYQVYAWDLSVRGAHLDQTHGYLNGTHVFLRVEGQDERPVAVEILPPGGEAYAGWRVATAMTRAGAQPYGFGAYRADSYDELIDHPVEMGAFDLVEFEAGDVPHALAVTGRHGGDLDRLARDLGRVCTHHIDFFGRPAPFDRYLFLLTVVGEGYGGLEHRASSSNLAMRDDLPRLGDEAVGEGYRNLLGLLSHEYFHAWNVKRIKPAAFIPYDLAREVHTGLLWVFEGMTAYYDNLALVRTGLITPESYLELLGQDLTRLQRGSGRTKQTLLESSFDAWTRFYKQDENAPNAIVSYYTKGALTALALDLTIRRDSEGDRALDDVMRALWKEHGKTGIGVEEMDVEALAQAVTGLDLVEFFDLALRSTDDLPLAGLLEAAGVQLHWRGRTDEEDKGGKPAEAPPRPPSWLGARLVPEGPEARLIHVFDGAAAQAAGLAAGDTIVALNGLRVGAKTLEKRIAETPPGTRVRIHAFRRDELLELSVELGPKPLDTAYLELDPAASDGALALRQAWLGQ